MNGRELRKLLGDLQVLVELSRLGTVTAAADELGIPQPSASRALGRLAARTGVVLTTRKGRALTLTDAGRQLAQASTDAIALIEDGLASARHSVLLENALVTIAYQTLLGESYLPRAIARYRARHPSVRFRLLHGARATCIDLVRAGQADLAVVADPPEDEVELRTTLLFSEPLSAVVARTHPLAGLDRPIRPEDLSQHDLIILGHGFGLHDSIRRILGTDELPTYTFEVDDYRMARSLAAAGAGVTILPPTAPGAQDDIAELPIEHPQARRTIGALTPKDSHPIGLDFLDALRAAAVRYHWPATAAVSQAQLPRAALDDEPPRPG